MFCVSKRTQSEGMDAKPQSWNWGVQNHKNITRVMPMAQSSNNQTKEPTEKIRCSVCGRFLSEKELEDAVVDFTPDTEFTVEETTFTHRSCLQEQQ